MNIILYHVKTKQWLTFNDPIETITAVSVSDIIPSLQLFTEKANRDHLYAAGYLAYEAAPAFDSHYCVHNANLCPLLKFGIYQSPIRSSQFPFNGNTKFELTPWQPGITRDQYDSAIAHIKDEIRRGNTYQVNYTFPLYGQFKGDHRALFYHLAMSQGIGYSALIEDDNHIFCSASPELFFTLDGQRLVSKPMKGTAQRGLYPKQDLHIKDQLFHSVKDRAENVMITDMIRNDMGHIAEYGSVRVTDLYQTERYPTIWQMTSRVESLTSAPVTDIFKALFPCSSITGAPKVKTMQIIRNDEPHPRGIYTGSIGFIGPKRQAQFNVAIRTLSIEKSTNKATYNIGSGIVWDSETNSEYDECLLKARVTERRHTPFKLLETLLWEPGAGYFLMDLHLIRLCNSARFFNFQIKPRKIRTALKEHSRSFTAPMRVRLLLDAEGQAEIESTPVTPGIKKPVNVRLADMPISSLHPWLYHKTTHRDIYDQFRNRFHLYDDVILYNEDDEITEGCIHNIVVKINGKLCTPPVDCGLLAGTFREYLLLQGEIKEQTITRDALLKANEIYLINSVRRWRRVDEIEYDGIGA